jgi:hypothetical protein
MDPKVKWKNEFAQNAKQNEKNEKKKKKKKPSQYDCKKTYIMHVWWIEATRNQIIK